MHRRRRDCRGRPESSSSQVDRLARGRKKKSRPEDGNPENDHLSHGHSRRTILRPARLGRSGSELSAASACETGRAGGSCEATRSPLGGKSAPENRCRPSPVGWIKPFVVYDWARRRPKSLPIRSSCASLLADERANRKQNARALGVLHFSRIGRLRSNCACPKSLEYLSLRNPGHVKVFFRRSLRSRD
jgi:hypothetical protein